MPGQAMPGQPAMSRRRTIPPELLMEQATDE
jgi:hypothetical protein